MDSNGTMVESTVPNGKKAEDEERTDDVRINEHLDFASLLLSPAVIKGLQNAGLERPSPIQLQAIPVGRCGLGEKFFGTILRNIEKKVFRFGRPSEIRDWKDCRFHSDCIGITCHIECFTSGLIFFQEKEHEVGVKG